MSNFNRVKFTDLTEFMELTTEQTLLSFTSLLLD